MKARLFRSLAVGSLAAGMVIAVASPRVGAASSDTDDSVQPTKTAVTGSSSNFTFSGTIDNIFITGKCTSLKMSGTTPKKGFTVNIAPPVFSKCTALGVSATISTNNTNGSWKLTFVDAANDETTEGPDKLKLTVPKAGATFTSGAISGCTVTIAPSGPASVTATYDDINTAQLTNAKLPVSGSGCTTTGPAKQSATVTVNPGIHDAS